MRKSVCRRLSKTLCARNEKMINPQIKEINTRYLELINLLNDDSQDIETTRILAATLSTLIHTKLSILENESSGNPKMKLRNNKVINALKASYEPLEFRTFTASFSEIKEAVQRSYEIFEEKQRHITI